jgi:hypothetical protein
VRIVAIQDDVARLLTQFLEVGRTDDGWTTILVDPSTGDRWRHTYLGAEYHGGRMPVLVKEPVPDAATLVDLCAHTSDAAEAAARAWLLRETDPVGTHREGLLRGAEDAFGREDHARARSWLGGDV